MNASHPQPLVTAVVQLTSTDNVDANLDAIVRLVREAASAGARFIALPENAAWLRIGPVERSPAEPLDGRIISTLRTLAESLHVHLLVGSYAEESLDPARYFNTSVLIDGTVRGAPITATYRKLHLFDIDVAGSESQRESDTIAAGSDIVVANVADVPTGLSICYDLRFPRLYERLVDRGALMLTIPAAFTEFTGKDHWMVLLRARAIETQTFVVAPDQSGFHGGKRRSYGKSTIIDPWGIPLCTAGDGPGFALARLDFERQAAIRASLPCLRHRHPAVHG